MIPSILGRATAVGIAIAKLARDFEQRHRAARKAEDEQLSRMTLIQREEYLKSQHERAKR